VVERFDGGGLSVFGVVFELVDGVLPLQVALVVHAGVVGLVEPGGLEVACAMALTSA
jgi:hypothetical protein